MSRFTTTLAAVLLGTVVGGTAGGDALSLLQDEAAAPGAAPIGNGPEDAGPPGGGSLMFERVERGTYASVGYLHEFGTDFGGGGSVAVDRVFASVGTKIQLHPDVTGSVGLAWGGDWYRFKGESDLALAPGAQPWTNAQAITALGFANWQLDRQWSLNLGLRLGFAGEPQANLGDSFTVGGNAAVSYAFSEKLSLGGGVLLSSQIEDSILAIPIVVVYWQVTDSVVVSNVLGPEAYPTGAGLEIAWRPDRVSEISIGSRYEVRRFRLDDTGPEIRRNGVGEDSGLPLWLRATWRFPNGIRMDLVGGVSLFNQYRLDDSNGGRIATADLDPAPFIAGFVSWRF